MSKTQLNLFDTLSEKFQKKLKKITHKTSKNKDNLSLKGWLLSYSNMDDEEPLTNKNVKYLFYYKSLSRFIASKKFIVIY